MIKGRFEKSFTYVIHLSQVLTDARIVHDQLSFDLLKVQVNGVQRLDPFKVQTTGVHQFMINTQCLLVAWYPIYRDLLPVGFPLLVRDGLFIIDLPQSVLHLPFMKIIFARL